MDRVMVTRDMGHTTARCTRTILNEAVTLPRLFNLKVLLDLLLSETVLYLSQVALHFPHRLLLFVVQSLRLRKNLNLSLSPCKSPKPCQSLWTSTSQNQCKQHQKS